MNNFKDEFDKDFSILIDMIKFEEDLFETGAGMISSSKMSDFLDKYHIQAIFALTNLIDSNKISTACSGEILRQISETKDWSLKSFAFLIFTDYLDHTSPKIRDGAITALSNLGDIDAVSFLKNALSKEKDDFIYSLIEKTINSLKIRNLSNKSVRRVSLSNSRRPENIINESIFSYKKDNPITAPNADIIPDEMEIPIKFPKGTLTKAEFVVLQAAGEQLGRIILNQIGNPLYITVKSSIKVDRDEYNRTKGFIITLTGILDLPENDIPTTDNLTNKIKDSSEDSTNLLEGDIY